jgi:DNA-binding SARP family transcriptional activator/tetratricopeptide (TPR) repeat protein
MLYLLGPVELQVGDRPVDVGPLQQQLVLAALAMDAGRPVPLATLIARVWGEDAEPKTRSSAYAYLTRLRQVLTGAAPRLVRRPGGYLLDIEPEQVDVGRFRWLVRAARDGADGSRRAELLDQAVELWRGPALSGLAGQWAARIRDRLEQERIDAVLAWAGARLAVGPGGPVVDRLRPLVEDHPLVEPAAARLIEALAGAGRTAEALDCYLTTRRRLVAELGTEPGAELRRLHQALLAGELDQPADGPAGHATAGATSGATRTATSTATGSPTSTATGGPTSTATGGPTSTATGGPTSSAAGGATSTATGGPRPAQLPLAVAGFTGRAAELAALDALLEPTGDDRPATVVISAIAGTAGVGKTALAVHWAHRIADRFPDGQLYMNLRGFTPGGQVVEPSAAVRSFLDALGVPAGRVPADPDAQAALYRSLLAGKRVLIVLDNARDAEQVRPLLPGTAAALVLVTSRDQLTSLVAADGAYPLALDVLSRADARQLLARRLGPPRLAGDPTAVDAILNTCAGLPLALTIAAARAAATQFPLTALAAELTAARGALGALDAGAPTTQVRAVLSWSYDALTRPGARLFRLLGLHPGPDFSAAAVASLAGQPPGEARPLLTELTRANLVTEHAPGRYGFHDLLAAYAAELTQQSDPDSARRAARLRLLDHYVLTAHPADRLLDPYRDPIPIPLAQPAPGATPEQPPDERTALSWLTAEHRVLLAALRLAAAAGLDRHVWQLAWVLDTFLQRQGHWHDAADAWRAALAAATRLAQPAAGAAAHRNLARAAILLDDHCRARTHLASALDLATQAGDLAGQGYAHRALAHLAERQQQPRPALEHAETALGLFEAAGHLRGQAHALNAAGWCHALLADHAGALVRCQRALNLYQQLGDRYGEAVTWDSLGYAHHHLAHHSQALDCYRNAVALARDLGDRYGEATTLTHLGDTHHAAGDPPAAHAAWRQALTILTDLDHADADPLRTKLGG